MVFSAFFALSAVFSVVACGKKGPPLPPLVKLPVAPTDLLAERRGNTVDLSFSVPYVNTDGTRPANVSRADVYAITAPVNVPPLSDEDLLKYGTKVGSVQVKTPRDPNLTANADDPTDEVEAPEGPGLDQGALARLAEWLTDDMKSVFEVPRKKSEPTVPVVAADTGQPLVGPSSTAPVRTYAALGISSRGKKGPLSARVSVPLVLPPPPPSAPSMTYDETAVTVSWTAATIRTAATGDGLLPSRVIGETAVTDDWTPVNLPSRAIGLPTMDFGISDTLPSHAAVPAPPPLTYNVYDTTNPDAAVRMTTTPLGAPPFSDPRIVWGETRCYVVVAAQIVDGATIESEAPPPTCETLVDSFPPAAPKGINAIASEGAINLIWEPNAEKDLAGYLVLRGVEPAETLEPVTPEPIAEPSFKDTLQPGVAYVYVVRAVDRAGNASAPSARVVETAR